MKPPLPGKPPLPQMLPATPAYIPPWESGVAGAKPFVNEDEDPGDAYNWSHLSTRVTVTRQLFVCEYVKDFHPGNAIRRLGYNYRNPDQTGYAWLKEPYTQYCLRKFIQEAKDEAIVTRGEVIAGLVREANGFGMDSDSSSRTAALRQLSKVLGMQITKVQTEVTAPGVMFVPMMGNADQWEQEAAAQQAKLKQTSAA